MHTDVVIGTGPDSAKASSTSLSVVERARLVRDLVAAVRGEVRFDGASRHLYANDASIYRMMPIGGPTRSTAARPSTTPSSSTSCCMTAPG